MLTLLIGLTGRLFDLAPQITYPFFTWSLFDLAVPTISDYMVRVTCEDDQEEFKVIVKVNDNLCIDQRPSSPHGVNRYYTLQNYLNGSDHSRLWLESLLGLKSYWKIIIYRRTFNIRDAFFKREMIKYEKYIEISSE